MARSESIASLFVELRGTIDKFVAEMDKASRAVAKTGRKLKSIGTDLSIAITAPIAGIATAALTAAKDFDAAMNKMAAKSNATAEEFKALEAQALELGKGTIFSAKQVAEGMAELAGAGFKAQDIAKAIPGVLDLAAASSMSVADAAEVAGNALNAFGMEMQESVRVADVLAKADAESNVSLRDLAYTMKYAAPNAKLAGIAFEEVAAAAALMGNAGIKAETAGTNLRMGMMRLLKPPKAAREAFDELGISLDKLKNQDGTLRPLVEIIDLLAKHGAKAEHVFRIFGVNAASGWARLLNIGAPALAEMTKKLEESDGAARKMAATLMQGLPGAWERTKGAIETASIAIGKALTPAAINVLGIIEKLADKVAELAQWFTTLSPTTQTVALGFVAIVAAIGPVLIIVGQLAFALRGLILLFGILANPALLIGAGVVGLGVALGLLAKKAWDSRHIIIAAIKDIHKAAAEWIDQKVRQIMDDFARGWEVLKEAVVNAVTGIYNGVKEWLGEKLTQIFDGIKQNIDDVKQWFQDLYESVVGHSSVPDLLEGIEDHFGRLDDVMTSPALKETEATAGAFSTMAGSIVSTMQKLSAELGGLFQDLFKGIGLTGEQTGFLGELVGSLLTGGKGTGPGGGLGKLIGDALGLGQGGLIASLNSALGFGRPEGVSGPLMESGAFSPDADVAGYVGPILQTVDAIQMLGGSAKETAAGLSEIAGTAIGAAFGGPAGAAIGNQIGSIAGKFLGGLFGGGKDPDTKARGKVTDFLNEKLSGKGLGEFSFGGLDFKKGWGEDIIKKFGAESVSVFTTVGEAIRKNLGIVEDIGPQIGAMLATHLNGNLSQTGHILAGLGLSAENLEDAFFQAAEAGEISWHQYNVHVQNLNKAFGETEGNLGTMTDAVNNFYATAGKGAGSLKTAQNLINEAVENGAKSFAQLKQKLLEGGMKPEDVEALFSAFAQRGILALEKEMAGGQKTLADIFQGLSKETWGAVIGDMEAASASLHTKWETMRQDIDDFKETVESIPDRIEKSVEIDVNVNDPTGALGALSTPPPPASTGAVPHAKGGIVSKPTMALMGERGPEAILPLTRIGGQLGVRAEVGSAQAGRIFNLHIDARGADPGVEYLVERAVMRMKRDIVDESISAVYNAQSRGGRFRDNF